jgi:hypothetical protein
LPGKNPTGVGNAGNNKKDANLINKAFVRSRFPDGADKPVYDIDAKQKWKKLIRREQEGLDTCPRFERSFSPLEGV